MKSVNALSMFILTSALLVSACSDTASTDPRTAVFNDWLTEAIPIFANSGVNLETIVDDYQCQNQEIGDSLFTEPACAGFRFLTADENPVSIQVDWSMSRPERWHADLMLDTQLKINCKAIQSSVEYQRSKNQFVELIACRTQAGSEVLILLATANTTIAYLSAEFVQAYPGYVSSVIQTIESSP